MMRVDYILPQYRNDWRAILNMAIKSSFIEKGISFD
jgi:hypothetical protein